MHVRQNSWSHDESKLCAVVQIGIWCICLAISILLHYAVVMAQLLVAGDILMPTPLPAAVAMLPQPAAVVLLGVGDVKTLIHDHHQCQSNW